jgi:hypothetical protein
MPMLSNVIVTSVKGAKTATIVGAITNGVL